VIVAKDEKTAVGAASVGAVCPVGINEDTQLGILRLGVKEAFVGGSFEVPEYLYRGVVVG
jgi:hypothetical protein